MKSIATPNNNPASVPCWICSLPPHEFDGEHIYTTRTEAEAAGHPDHTAAAFNGASLRAEAGHAL